MNEKTIVKFISFISFVIEWSYDIVMKHNISINKIISNKKNNKIIKHTNNKLIIIKGI